MEKIISLTKSENFDELLETYLGNTDFYAEICDYLINFYHGLRFWNSDLETPLYMQLAKNGKKFMPFFEKDPEIIRIFHVLINDHWAFWATLFLLAGKKKLPGKSDCYDCALLAKAYKCWLLLYLQKFAAPQHIYSLLAIPEVGKETEFDEAFFLMASSQIIQNDVLNQPLIRFLYSAWNTCPKAVKKETIRNLKKIKLPDNSEKNWDLLVLLERSGAVSSWKSFLISAVPVIILLLILYLFFNYWL